MNSGCLYRDGGILTNLSYEDGIHEIGTYLWITVTTSNEDVFNENSTVKTHKRTDVELTHYYKFVEGIGIIRNYGQTGYNGETYDRKTFGCNN